MTSSVQSNLAFVNVPIISMQRFIGGHLLSTFLTDARPGRSPPSSALYHITSAAVVTIANVETDATLSRRNMRDVTH